MEDYILQMKHITKSFPGVRALNDVSLDVERGSVHALLGENGAGKSTLIKILNGLYKADSGEIFLDGEKVLIKDTIDALNKGISFVFQELNLISSLSVAENIFLGRQLKTKSGLVDWKSMNQKTKQILDELEFKIEPTAIVERLSVAEKQMVEIARALSTNVKLIVMDEPSATLTKKELEVLFRTVRRLQKQNVTVLYISHRLEEIYELCDKATILRDGMVVSTYNVKDLVREQMIKDMVGRSIDQEFPVRTICTTNEEVLRVENLSTKSKLKDINFALKKGEILGLAGLVGSGRTEIARAIFGADRRESGNFYINGEKVRITNPSDAMKNGIALLPEDRKDQGLALKFSIEWNVSVANLEKICKSRKLKVLNVSKEKEVADYYVEAINIKTSSVKKETEFLSGGNQQKVVIGKWLFAGMDILLLDEPTRGIDVGAKYEIYCLMDEIVRQGKSIILISSEMPEIVSLCDRVLVMNSGEIKAELTGKEIDSESILECAI
ncbi:sugar ABC transporter ATP-binding protein [Christensenella intestinihominis]|uniref:sugar ABC transporter ATP-binding protein n=1 Tax=Christensenella intestinihominis TaxID=1851429 RepID=UPI00082F007F|nr:sugar ABC transporter ATP-binding protein [Christensenella intestinihominis]